MPLRKPGDALPGSVAIVNLASPPVAAASAPSPAARTEAPAPPSRKPWLWAALLLALAVMGAMAFTLLKGAKAPPAAEPPPQA
jgi:hypothetical protein